MIATKNIIDVIDAIKANSVSEKQFESVWGISLDDHMKKMMEHVRETDARVKERRGREEQ
jgi:cystathionine beta-lyase family protein involved in aluminum resistance